MDTQEINKRDYIISPGISPIPEYRRINELNNFFLRSFALLCWKT